MKNKQLVTVRSNCDFGLNYETGRLVPQVEVILITASPCYEINKKSEITKGTEIDEFRFKSSLDGINQLIGELQIVVQNMNNFEQLAGSFNTIIESNKPKS